MSEVLGWASQRLTPEEDTSGLCMYRDFSNQENWERIRSVRFSRVEKMRDSGRCRVASFQSTCMRY